MKWIGYFPEGLIVIVVNECEVIIGFDDCTREASEFEIRQEGFDFFRVEFLMWFLEHE